MNEQEQAREYRTISYLASTLANICAGSPNQVIDALTGLLWDEEEAVEIKVANMKTYNKPVGGAGENGGGAAGGAVISRCAGAARAAGHGARWAAGFSAEGGEH